MTLRIGTLRGLDACSSPTGRLSVLALDHRNNLRRMLGPDDPDAVSYGRLVDTKRAVVRALTDTATGVLLDPELGAAHAVLDGSLHGGAGLIVAVETSGYSGPTTARSSSLLASWSVSQAKRMGADAVKLLLYYHPDAATAPDQEKLLMEVAEECADVDMPLFLETLGYSIDEAVPKLTGDARRDVVVRTAHRLTALGGDILKCEFPYDAVGDRPRPLVGGLPRDRAGVGHPLGHPLRRRGRRHLRGPDRDGLPGRGLRCPRGPLGVGRRRGAAAGRAGRLAGRGGRGADDAPRRHRGTRRPAVARALAAVRAGRAGRGLVSRLPGVTGAMPAWGTGPDPSVRDLDVYVIGDVNPDILVIDEDAVPEFGQVEKLVGTIRLTVGGSSAITACGLARLGLRVAHGGIVGDDLLGHAILEALRQHGVVTSTISVEPAIPTGATVVLGKGDDRALLTATGTIDRLRAEDVPRDILPRVRHLHAGSTAIQPRLRPGLPELFREARAAGATSSFDTNWDPDRRWEGIDGLLASADIFFPNEREAALIAGIDDPLDAARALAARGEAAGREAGAGPLTVVVKLGAQGALVVRGAEALRLPADRVRVVDSTGAGDSFDAGFIFAFLAGRPLAECLALGVACGTLSTRAVGGVDGQATLEEAEALL